MEGAKKQEVLSQYGKVPAFFIENKGQTDNKVKYYFKGNDNVYFTDDGVMFQKTVKESKSLESGVRNQKSEDKESAVGAGFPRPHKHDEVAPTKALAYKLEFIGARPTSPQARNELQGKVNYLIGNDRSKWHSNISTYQEIVYPNLYPAHSSLVQSSSIEPNVSVQAASLNQQEEAEDSGGIDLVYKGVPGGMKYEFIVQPGADPDVIQLAYTGIEGLSIDDKGSLIIHTSLGDVKDTKPYCYQEIDGKQVEVACNFKIIVSENTPPTPLLLEGRPDMFPSNQEEKGSLFPLYQEGIKGCVVNPQFIYGFQVTSWSLVQSSSIEPNVSVQAASLNQQEAKESPQFIYGFTIASYNHNYPLVIDPGLEYSTFLGGWSADGGNGIAVDGSGYAYVTGTASNDFPTTAGAFDTSFNGDADAFVTKLNLVPPKICHTCPSLFIVKRGKTECKKFKVWNCGEGTLNWTVSEDCDWLTLSPSSGTSTGEEDEITACVTAGKKAKGNCECTVTITGEGAPNSPQTCIIKLRVK